MKNIIANRIEEDRKTGTFTVTKYGQRYFAVISPEGELVCVTLYRKGSQKVVDLLHSTDSASATSYAA